MPGQLTRVEIAQARLRTELVGPRGLVTRYVLRQVRAIRNRAVLITPVDTGNLRASITYAVSSPTTGGGLIIEGRVGTPVEYAVAVHEGHYAMSVVVPTHTVRAHVRKGHRVKSARAAPTGKQKRGSITRRAYVVGPHTVKQHTVKQHWRTLPARAGRPFLRRAMEEVLANPV